MELGGKNQKIAAIVKDNFDEWTRKIREVVKEAQASGQVRNDVSAAILARHIVAVIEGGIMFSKLEERGAPLKDCLNSLRMLLGLKK